MARKSKQLEGLTLIEILIVIAISGFVLVALSFLAAQDLQIEKQNEQRNLANTVAVSWEQSFSNLLATNPTCLNQIAQAFTNQNISTYYICNKGDGLYPTTNLPSALISACENSSNYYLASPTTGTFTTVDLGNNFECSTTGSSTNIYQAQLNVNSVTTSPNQLTVNINTKYTAVDSQTYNYSLSRQYEY